MRKLFLFLSLLLAHGAIHASTLRPTYTAIDELTQHFFIMAYGDNGVEKTHYRDPEHNTGAPQNALWGEIATAKLSDDYFVMKAEPITVDGTTHYALNAYKLDGTELQVNGGKALQPYQWGYLAGANDPNYKYSTQSSYQPGRYPSRL